MLVVFSLYLTSGSLLSVVDFFKVVQIMKMRFILRQPQKIVPNFYLKKNQCSVLFLHKLSITTSGTIFLVCKSGLSSPREETYIYMSSVHITLIIS